MALTDTWLRKKHNKRNEKEIVKADQNGLYARIRDGKITFVYRPYYNKKQIKMTVGSYPNLSLKDARRKIIEYENVLNQGIDPRTWVRMQKLENLEALSLDTVVDRWFKDVCSKRNKQWKNVEATYKKNIGSKYGTVVAESITLVAWRNLLYGLGKKKPHAAGVCITVVKSALKHAIATGAIKGPSALRDVDRADFINRENKKEASVLSLDQLDEVLKQISTWTDYRNKAFMLLLIFYGCRGRELRLTKQSWVGKDRWTIPANAHKTGKGDLIRPVLPEMEHLWDCAREYSGCPTQMFTNYAGKTKPSVDALSRSAVTGIVKTIVLVSGKIKVISPHVFRKTARTHWAGDYVCCEKMLGHTVSAVADIYDRRDWSIEMIPIYRHWFETLRNLDNGHVFDPKFLRR